MTGLTLLLTETNEFPIRYEALHFFSRRVQVEYGVFDPTDRGNYPWEITPDGRLVIATGLDNYAELTLISRSRTEIVVRTSQGSNKKYKIITVESKAKSPWKPM